jgi:hypothetical protein
VQNSKQNLHPITTTTCVTRTRGPTKPHARKENRKNEAARDHHCQKKKTRSKTPAPKRTPAPESI